MNCDFTYCIYNKHAKCLLKETQINALGMCEECIVVSIPDRALIILKEEQAKRLEE